MVFLMRSYEQLSFFIWVASIDFFWSDGVVEGIVKAGSDTGYDGVL
jgi:hypothetical protein